MHTSAKFKGRAKKGFVGIFKKAVLTKFRQFEISISLHSGFKSDSFAIGCI